MAAASWRPTTSGPADLEERLEGWLIKALREGKERSDWNEPDHDYEQRAPVVPAGGPDRRLRRSSAP